MVAMCTIALLLPLTFHCIAIDTLLFELYFVPINYTVRQCHISDSLHQTSALCTDSTVPVILLQCNSVVCAECTSGQTFHQLSAEVLMWSEMQ